MIRRLGSITETNFIASESYGYQVNVRQFLKILFWIPLKIPIPEILRKGDNMLILACHLLVYWVDIWGSWGTDIDCFVSSKVMSNGLTLAMSRNTWKPFCLFTNSGSEWPWKGVNLIVELQVYHSFVSCLESHAPNFTSKKYDVAVFII